MKSTIGVGPSCLLKNSFQDPQDANLSKPYVCQESPKACGDPNLSSKALTSILPFDVFVFKGRLNALGTFHRFRSCLVCF